jgi:hypothetical protein
MRLLKRLLKGLAWVAGSFVGLVVVLYLVLLAINWRDRPPSETALRFAADYRDRPAVADTDNGFVYVTGSFVKPGEDPQAAGVRRIAWLNEEFRKPDHGYIAPPEKEYDFKAARSPAVRAISDACREPGSECLQAMKLGSATLAEWSASERWLLERYQTLIALPAWLETAPLEPQMPLPSYNVATEGQRLLFVEAWKRAGEKDVAGVRNLLSQDVRFWRHTLECSDMLISKMIAVAGLRRHFKFANLVLRRLPAGSEAQARPPEWDAEITRSERSMMRTLVGEWVFASHILEQEKVSDWWPPEEEGTFVKRVFQLAAAPLFQKQDFSNEQAVMFVKVNAALDVPYSQYRDAIPRARAILNGSQGELPMFRLYNPIGAFFRWINSWNYETYSERVVDIEGQRRAALLASELRSRGVTAAQVAAELATSAIRDPYSGEPLGWDAQKGVLTFTGLERAPRGVHEYIF